MYHKRGILQREVSAIQWGVINETIKKVKHKGSITPYITVDGIKHNKPKDIANNDSFFSKLGATLAAKIVPGGTNVNDYISKIPRQLSSMVLRHTTIHEIDRLIKNLPNKSSHGHDEISNLMLKSLCTSITFPLCHIFNQSIQEGVFPKLMKSAEVIILYKGKEMAYMIN